MTGFARTRPPGATFAFTCRLQDQSSDLLVREINHLRRATRVTMARFPFRIDAIAVLPSVIHTIWTLPAGDRDYPARWQLLKSRFSRGLPAQALPDGPGNKDRGKGIWKRRFEEHRITDETDFNLRRDLILKAPVHTDLVRHPAQWPHSSWHRDQRTGGTHPVFGAPSRVAGPSLEMRPG